MNEQELFQKNLELSTEFSRYILEHPDMEAQIPEGAQIVFVIENDPQWTERNLELARKNHEPGQPAVMVRIKGLAPRQSRLIDPHLQKVANL